MTFSSSFPWLELVVTDFGHLHQAPRQEAEPQNGWTVPVTVLVTHTFTGPADDMRAEFQQPSQCFNSGPLFPAAGKVEWPNHCTYRRNDSTSSFSDPLSTPSTFAVFVCVLVCACESVICIDT